MAGPVKDGKAFSSESDRLDHYKDLNRRRTPSGRIEIKFGTVQAGETKQVDFPERTRHLHITNTDSNDIGFSTKSTGPWARILANDVIDLFAEVDRVWISGSAANQGYEIVIVL